jgi:nucleotide-binding universal stress UspA family protein
MITIKNVLVATDFSQPSDAALTYGRALARNFDATLHVVHVIGNISALVYGAEMYAVSMPEMQQEVADAARKQLTELLIDNDPPPLRTRAIPTASADAFSTR